MCGEKEDVYTKSELKIGIITNKIKIHLYIYIYCCDNGHYNVPSCLFDNTCDKIERFRKYPIHKLLLGGFFFRSEINGFGLYLRMASNTASHSSSTDKISNMAAAGSDGIFDEKVEDKLEFVLTAGLEVGFGTVLP